MKDTQKSSNKLIDDSVSFARIHCNEFDVPFRKQKGQFFTPKKVANFMANLFDLTGDTIRILDPGAGTGILIAAVCDRICDDKKTPCKLFIDAYENDGSLIPLLQNTLTLCHNKLLEYDHELSLNVFNSNFILDNNQINSQSHSDSTKKRKLKYDLVISNPPYYKLNVRSPESQKLKEFVFGQPNIYSLFMISAMQLLKNNGNFIFIIPRSFCSGLYYKKIRNWFVKNTQIQFIHCFESRLKIFEDNVTQEIVIFYGVKVNPDIKKVVTISISDDKSFKNHLNFLASNKIIFEEKSSESFIRIPHSESDLKIIQEIDTWENTLSDLGLDISTGKVVDFRTKENLVFHPEEKTSVPLLWMHNLKDGNIEWPSKKYSKPQWILLNSMTDNQLISVNNYILLKRFTSKNQKRRLYATPLLKTDFQNYSFIGLENHLNYIFGFERSISIIDLLGITALMNTSFYDTYYRTFSGSTQVNANEMRKIPLPNREKIIAIGELVKNDKCLSSKDLDIKIGKILDFNESILKIIKQI
jgi:adenine-specific DNA-methyltransferase